MENNTEINKSEEKKEQPLNINENDIPNLIEGKNQVVKNIPTDSSNTNSDSNKKIEEVKTTEVKNDIGNAKNEVGNAKNEVIKNEVSKTEVVKSNTDKKK